MRPEDAALRIAADVLDDIERTRIANENRLRAVTEDGFGGSPQAASIQALIAGLQVLEHDAELTLRRTLRRHPLGSWVQGTVGVGEKQGARLLAAIGDPYWHSLYDRPRLVSELWAFAGYHVHRIDQTASDTHAAPVDAEQTPVSHEGADTHAVAAGGIEQGDPGHSSRDAQSPVAAVASEFPVSHSWLDTHEARADGTKQGDPSHSVAGNQRPDAGVAPKRRKGQRANWSGQAKMRAHLVAESCMKQRRSPYRDLYDKRKNNTEGRTHVAPCPQCGPKGKPAQVGSPWSDGHRHADALRIVAKEILRDLWREARQLHEQPASQTGADAQRGTAGGPQDDSLSQSSHATQDGVAGAATA